MPPHNGEEQLHFMQRRRLFKDGVIPTGPAATITETALSHALVSATQIKGGTVIFSTTGIIILKY